MWQPHFPRLIVFHCHFCWYFPLLPPSFFLFGKLGFLVLTQGDTPQCSFWMNQHEQLQIPRWPALSSDHPSRIPLLESLGRSNPLFFWKKWVFGFWIVFWGGCTHFLKGSGRLDRIFSHIPYGTAHLSGPWTRCWGGAWNWTPRYIWCQNKSPGY